MTTTLYNSSLGRIYMMLRADVVNNKRTLLVFLGAFLALVYGVPRIFGILNVGLAQFNEIWKDSYKFSVVEGLMTICTTIYFFFYVNRRVVHSEPSLFSTLPARLWEKVVSIIVFGLVLSLLGGLVVHIEYLLEYITVPQLGWHSSINDILPTPIRLLIVPYTLITGLAELSNEKVPWVDLGLLTMFVAWVYLLSQLILFFCSTHIRNAFVGLCCSCGISLGLLLLLITLSATFFQSTPLYNISDIDTMVTNYSIFLNVYAVGFVALFAYLCYRKLRRIRS